MKTNAPNLAYLEYSGLGKMTGVVSLSIVLMKREIG